MNIYFSICKFGNESVNVLVSNPYRPRRPSNSKPWQCTISSWCSLWISMWQSNYGVRPRKVFMSIRITHYWKYQCEHQLTKEIMNLARSMMGCDTGQAFIFNTRKFFPLYSRKVKKSASASFSRCLWSITIFCGSYKVPKLLLVTSSSCNCTLYCFPILESKSRDSVRHRSNRIEVILVQWLMNKSTNAMDNEALDMPKWVSYTYEHLEIAYTAAWHEHKFCNVKIQVEGPTFNVKWS